MPQRSNRNADRRVGGLEAVAPADGAYAPHPRPGVQRRLLDSAVHPQTTGPRKPRITSNAGLQIQPQLGFVPLEERVSLPTAALISVLGRQPGRDRLREVYLPLGETWR